MAAVLHLKILKCWNFTVWYGL